MGPPSVDTTAQQNGSLTKSDDADADGDVDDADFVFTVGESSGKASRSLATYTPGPAGMAYAQEASTSAVSDIARAKMVRNSSLILYINVQNCSLYIR